MAFYTGAGGLKTMKGMYIGVNGAVREVKQAYICTPPPPKK